VVKTVEKWRTLVLSIHRIGGLLAGVLLLVLAATGCIMAFESEIDGFFHPSLFNVVPHGEALPLRAIIPSVAAVLRPQERIQICVPSSKPTISYSFTIEGSGRLPRQIFADQYTAHVLGTLSVARFVLIMHALHEANGILMGCSAIVLILSVTSGLYLWWPQKRIKISVSWPSRLSYFDLHNSVGFMSSLFFLVFALTGVYMAFDTWTVPATYKITGSRPLRGDPPSTPQESARPVSPDYALEAAKKSLSHAIPLWIVMPQEREKPYLVKMRFPEDHSSNGTSIVWVDQYSGKVLTVWNSRTAPLGRKIQNLNRVFHTGEVLGYPGKMLACVVSFALAIQTLTGFSLWRKDRRQRIAILDATPPKTAR
jgi:uncharacterized iron-regulated membrane protein